MLMMDLVNLLLVQVVQIQLFVSLILLQQFLILHCV